MPRVLCVLVLLGAAALAAWLLAGPGAPPALPRALPRGPEGDRPAPALERWREAEGTLGVADDRDLCGALEVHVLDDTGAGATGVYVALEGPTAAAEIVAPATFQDLAAGSYRVRVAPRGGAPLWYSGEVWLAPGARTRVDLQLGTFDGRLAGTVHTPEGAAVTGLCVAARRLPEHAEAGDLEPVDAATWSTESRLDGSWEVTGIGREGDYLVSAESADGLLVAREVVRAGTLDADLVVAGSRLVRVTGTVRDPGGRLLAGVSVHPFGQRERGVESAADGTYALDVSVPEALAARSIVFRLAGFQVLHRVLEDRAAGQPLVQDVTLEPSHGTAPLGGWIHSHDGTGVSGVTVYVFCDRLHRRFRAVSDEEGRFVVPAAEVGAGYRLLVRPRDGRWRDLVLEGLDLPSEGVTDLRLLVEALGRGTVRLALRDPAGSAIPSLRLELRSAWSALNPATVTTDVRGTGEVADFPEGPLTVASAVWPRFVLRGPVVRAGAPTVVEGVLDRGTLRLRGEVVGADGRPRAGVQVVVTSDHERGGAVSHTYRLVRTDAQGEFGVFDVGPGPHRFAATSGPTTVEATWVAPGPTGPIRIVLPDP